VRKRISSLSSQLSCRCRCRRRSSFRHFVIYRADTTDGRTDGTGQRRTIRVTIDIAKFTGVTSESRYLERFSREMVTRPKRGARAPKKARVTRARHSREDFPIYRSATARAKTVRISPDTTLIPGRYLLTDTSDASNIRALRRDARTGETVSKIPRRFSSQGRRARIFGNVHESLQRIVSGKHCDRRSLLTAAVAAAAVGASVTRLAVS